MKSFMIKSALLACTLVLTLSLTSCQKDAELASDNGAAVHATVTDPDKGVIAISEGDQGYQDEVIKAIEGHQVNLDDIQEVSFTRPDGSVDELYMIEGDIEVTKDQLQQLRADNASGAKQYRTSNLVSPQVITVIGYTGSCCALTSKMQTGLRWAVNNYNRLPLNISFSLSYGASTNADIVVYNNGRSGGGGSAGFPSGGQPYKWVQINAGTNSFSTNVNEHVIGHEIGHCIGFRHTDYFSRQSCGQNVNEGSAGVGAIHIPGTPTGYDANSLMLACFNSGVDGEFGSFDITALNFLY